jgi:peptide/nickel transport system substrate-binding protein
LQANPDWPGNPAPAFENILVRFYDDPASVRRSLVEFQSIDVAWTGLPYSDFTELSELDLDGDGAADFSAWVGPAAFKSYIIFEQSNPPWDSENIRQAAAFAIDREALVTTVFSASRRALLSPIPDEVPGHVDALPPRDLDQARALLSAEGYSGDNPLSITLWYVNDGRYSPVEEAYAAALEAQLEETGVFQVELGGASWQEFRLQIAQCGYPAYLLGWPSPGQTVNYFDASSWTDFFVEDTASVFCSNYESEQMAEVVTAAREEVDAAARQAVLADMQELWAEELPTLDLTQEPRRAISLTTIENVAIDAMGLMHYELLTKEEER